MIIKEITIIDNDLEVGTFDFKCPATLTVGDTITDDEGTIKVVEIVDQNQTTATIKSQYLN